MAVNYELGPYDPCPCGSGKKYKFCCAEKAKANRHGKFPAGTVAYFGPDDKTITKITAGVFLRENAERIAERFRGSDVAGDAKVTERIKKFFARHGVKNVVTSDGVIGCPHETGVDFPEGQDCPYCPWWAGKRNLTDNSDDDADQADYFDDEDDDLDDDELDRQAEQADDAIARFEAIVGDDVTDRDQAVDKVLAHLQANLQFPCEVTGSEDFRWEEPYVIGGLNPKEYRRLKKTHPSYRHRYQLLDLAHDGYSEWMMFWDEDISAHVRRISDGKEFILGLAELKATDKQSPNYRLLDDYATWFVNTR